MLACRKRRLSSGHTAGLGRITCCHRSCLCCFSTSARCNSGISGSHCDLGVVVQPQAQLFQLSGECTLCGHNISDVCTKQIAELEQDCPLGLALVLPLNPLFGVVCADYDVSGTAGFVHLSDVLNSVKVLVHLVNHGECSSDLGIYQMVEPTTVVCERAHCHLDPTSLME